MTFIFQTTKKNLDTMNNKICNACSNAKCNIDAASTYIIYIHEINKLQLLGKKYLHHNHNSGFYIKFNVNYYISNTSSSSSLILFIE